VREERTENEEDSISEYSENGIPLNAQRDRYMKKSDDFERKPNGFSLSGLARNNQVNTESGHLLVPSASL
jgi:hypothetical protein